MLRQFSREPGRIVGAIIVILVVAPLVLAIAVGSAIGYRRLPDQWPGALLGGILVALWGVWLLFPIFFSGINEGADLTRLLVYPLARRDLITGFLLGTLFDYPTYLMLPLFIAVFVGWGGGAALPVVVVALFLCYAHMVLIGQLVYTAIGGILQSRRFRDVAIIVASLLGFSCYFIQVGFQRLTSTLSRTVSEEQILALRPLEILQWFPTGGAARAIERGAAGEWGMAMLWLGYTAVLLLIVTWAWWRLLVRITTGEGFLFSLPPRAEKKKEKRAPVAGSPSFLAWLPDDVVQMLVKELKIVWRLPQRRVSLIQGFLLPLFMLGPFLFSDSFSFQLPSWTGLGLPFYALFLTWINTQNMLAWEGRGLPTLLLSPVSRHRIFLAKSIALLAVTNIPFLILGVVIIVLVPGPMSVGSILSGLCAGIAATAVTSVSSVLFPVRLNLERKSLRRGMRTTGGGCTTGLANAILVPLALAAFGLPAVIPLALTAWTGQVWILLIGVPLVAAYAFLLFWFGTRFAGSLLLEREAEVWKALQISENTEG